MEEGASGLEGWGRLRQGTRLVYGHNMVRGPA